MTEPFKRNGTTYYLTDKEYDALVDQIPALRTPTESDVVYYDDVQARYWLADVLRHTRPTPMRAGDQVAMALARLVGADLMVTTTWRKLSGAVAGPDWFTRDGVNYLVEAGWLGVETGGKGCRAKTTFHLTPGGRIGCEATLSEAC